MFDATVKGRVARLVLDAVAERQIKFTSDRDERLIKSVLSDVIDVSDDDMVVRIDMYALRRIFVEKYIKQGTGNVEFVDKDFFNFMYCLIDAYSIIRGINEKANVAEVITLCYIMRFTLLDKVLCNVETYKNVWLSGIYAGTLCLEPQYGGPLSMSSTVYNQAVYSLKRKGIILYDEKRDYLYLPRGLCALENDVP